MKRTHIAIAEVADPDLLRFAAWRAAKGKRYRPEVMEYFKEIDHNTLKIRAELLGNQVQFGPYRHFKVYEPKERNICASPFVDQVVHHALMLICHDTFERYQIFDSYASRKGKGTYAALERAKYFTNRYTWYLKLDVRKYFDSVHHSVLKRQLSDCFKGAEVLALLERVIDSYQTEAQRGLPIGNLTSQYFANHYLAPLDHFIKEKLHIMAYVRYMDDMVLWSDDKAILVHALAAINQYVGEQLLCNLKPIQLNKCTTGLPFLGYHVFPHHTRLLQASRKRFVKKLNLVEWHYQQGDWTEANCQRHVLPLLAFLQHADTYTLKKAVISRIEGVSSSGR
jgi:RNA-directed DNA polymerase